LERRRRRGLALLRRLIDTAPHVGLDRCDRLLADAELPQPLAIKLDRIALLPLLEFALGAIFRGLGARMAAVAIGHALDQRGAAARTRPGISGGSGAVDDVGVIAVDDDALEPVSRGAIGGGMLDRRHLADRGIFHIEVVLADEDHRQLPY